MSGPVCSFFGRTHGKRKDFLFRKGRIRWPVRSKSIFSLKGCALQTARPVVSRKKRRISVFKIETLKRFFRCAPAWRYGKKNYPRGTARACRETPACPCAVRKKRTCCVREKTVGEKNRNAGCPAYRSGATFLLWGSAKGGRLRGRPLASPQTLFS